MLEKQRDLAREALAYFNSLAHELKFPELRVQTIRETLRPRVDQQVSSWVSVARIGMLAMLGGEGDFRATFDQFIRDAGAVRG
jgi:hypothetical protein